MNPFTPNLSELTDEELLAKINTLYSKMRIVMNNPPVYRQMTSVMNDYQTEQRARMQRKMEEFEKSELNKKIDIGQ